MTDTTQPEALRIADEFDWWVARGITIEPRLSDAAAELRRLHARVTELEAAPQAAPAVPDGVMKAIKAARMILIRGVDGVYALIPNINATAQCDGGTCGIGGYCNACPKQAAPQPEAAPQMLIARSLAEWHEEDGYVAWWAWNGREWAGEPAWIGSPNCDDWPGYHTHWTPHPAQPASAALAAKGGV